MRRHLRSNKFVLCLGGEHTLTQATALAAATLNGPIGVVQFDAHADLRDTYEGDPFSHACVLRRIHELDIPHLGVGIRSLSATEGEFIEAQGLPMIWGQELDGLSLHRFRRAGTDSGPDSQRLHGCPPRLQVPRLPPRGSISERSFIRIGRCRR